MSKERALLIHWEKSLELSGDPLVLGPLQLQNSSKRLCGLTLFHKLRADSNGAYPHSIYNCRFIKLAAFYAAPSG